MTVINALSTKAPVANPEEGSSFTNASQADPNSAASIFAAIFGGWLNSVSGQGQDSGNQSNEPAGKEANSGRHALLGLDGLQGLMGVLQNRNLQEAFGQGISEQGDQIGRLVSNSEQLDFLLAQLDRMSTPNPSSNSQGNAETVILSGMTEQFQGDSPQSELDLYKNVISNLLKKMSGEIRVKDQSLRDLTALTQQKSEIFAQRYNSGLFIAMSEETSAISEITRETPIISGTSEETQIITGTPEEMLTSSKLLAANITEKGKMRGSNLLDDNKQALRSASVNNLGLEEEIDFQGQDLEFVNSSLFKTESSGLTKDLHKDSGSFLADNHSREGSKTKQSTPEAPDFSPALLNGTKDASSVQGKISINKEVPVWTQIAQEIFDKAYQARPQLREMTIQLHPEHLGQINISMNWEDGQVHLRMVASELGTSQLLQANLGELRDNLTQLGIPCGQMEMGEQRESFSEQQRRESSSSSKDNSGNLELLEMNLEESDRVLSLEEPVSGANRINVKA